MSYDYFSDPRHPPARKPAPAPEPDDEQEVETFNGDDTPIRLRVTRDGLRLSWQRVPGAPDPLPRRRRPRRRL